MAFECLEKKILTKDDLDNKGFLLYQEFGCRSKLYESKSQDQLLLTKDYLGGEYVQVHYVYPKQVKL